VVFRLTPFYNTYLLYILFLPKASPGTLVHVPYKVHSEPTEEMGPLISEASGLLILLRLGFVRRMRNPEKAGIASTTQPYPF
jgi:hypothetical protein